MNDDNLVVHESTDIQLVDEHASSANRLSPLVLAAMDKNLDTDKLNQLLEIQAKFEAMEAEKAYNRAMSDFKSNAPTIKKDKLVSYVTDKGTTQYRHASLGYALTEINPVLSKFGLSLTFRARQENGQTIVTAQVTHLSGHSESTELGASPDSSGGKNGIQSIASTVTYLKRHTAFALLGLEGIDDDDGNGYMSNIEYITAEEEADLISLVEDVGANSKLFLKFLKINEYSQLPKNKLKSAISKLEQKRKANA